MAAGDILSCAINADGRSGTAVVAGVGVGGTYLYDAANSELVNEATAKIAFSVTSDSLSGTTPTTVVRASYGAITQRVAGTAGLDETAGGGNVTIKFALSEPIYNDDTVTCAFLAGWYTQGGTPSNAGTPSVTNNSTLDYFVPFGQWDIFPAEIVHTNFRVAFTPLHIYRTKAVKFTAVGATSGHSQTATVTDWSSRLCPETNLYVSAFEATIPIAGYTQGEQINLRSQVYQGVGDTPMDTDDYSADVEATGRGPRWVVCDKNSTLRAYAVVNASTGNDGTGVVSTTLATAEAAKYATIKAAIDADATTIYLEGTAHNFASRAVTKTTNYWITVEPHPSEGGTVAVTINAAFCGTLCHRLRFRNVTIKLSASNSVFYGADRDEYLFFDGCAHDANTFTAAEGHVDYNGVYFRDCTFDDGAKWKLAQSASDKFRFVLDGCVIPTAGVVGAFWRIAGCVITGCTKITMAVAAADTKPTNVLVMSNKIMGYGGDGQVELFSFASQTGHAFVGNILEGITASVTPGQLLSICEDAPYDIDHVIIAHNTMVGERQNIFYNSSGSTAYHSRGIAFIGNICQELDTKHDVFGTPNANRVGRWWFNYGTRMRGNLTIDVNFPPEWPGVNFSSGGTPDFTDDKTGTTGSGDYSLSPSSDAIGLITANDAMIGFDMLGLAITNDAGALQIQDAGALLLTIDGDPVAEDATVQLSPGSHTIRVTASGGPVEVTGVTLGGGVGGTLTGLIDTIIAGDHREVSTLSISGDGTLRITSDAGDGQFDVTVEMTSTGGGGSVGDGGGWGQIIGQ